MQWYSTAIATLNPVKPTNNAPEGQVPAAAGTNDLGVLRNIFSPGFFVLLAIAAVLVVKGFLVAAGDTNGDHQGYFFMALGAAALPTLWAVLRTLWSKEPNFMLALSSVVPAGFLATLSLTLVAMGTVLVPSVTATIYSARRPPHGFHYFFAEESGHPVVSALLTMGLAGMIIAILVGLLAAVVIVIPVVAFRHQRAFTVQNQLDTSPEYARTNAAAGKAIAILLILIFVVPTLIVVGAKNAQSTGLLEALAQCWQVFSQPQIYWADMAWVLGVAFIPVGVFLLIYIRIKQRPDASARTAAGTSSLWPQKNKP